MAIWSGYLRYLQHISNFFLNRGAYDFWRMGECDIERSFIPRTGDRKIVRPGRGQSLRRLWGRRHLNPLEGWRKRVKLWEHYLYHFCFWLLSAVPIPTSIGQLYTTMTARCWLTEIASKRNPHTYTLILIPSLIGELLLKNWLWLLEERWNKWIPRIMAWWWWF